MTVPEPRYTPLPAPAENTFVWRKQTKKSHREIPIRVTWRPARITTRSWGWVAVKVTIDAGRPGLTASDIRAAPWSEALQHTHPDRAGRWAGAAAELVHVEPAPVTETAKPSVSLEAISKDLGVRAYNALRRVGVTTVEEAMLLPDENLRMVPSVGEKTADHIRTVLERYRVG